MALPRGVGRGHWAMATRLGAEGALCDWRAPSTRECVYKENVVVGLKAPRGASNDEKSLRSPSNDDRTVPSLGRPEKPGGPGWTVPLGPH